MTAPFTQRELFHHLGYVAVYHRPQAEFCPISLQPSKLYTKTSCKHIFDLEALLTWLQDTRNTCPVCRQRLYIRPTSDVDAARFLRSNRLHRALGPHLDARNQISRDHLNPYVSEASRMVRAGVGHHLNADQWDKVLIGINHTLWLFDKWVLTPRQLRNRLFVGVTRLLKVQHRDWPQYLVYIDPVGGLFERHVDEVLDLIRDVFASGVAYGG